MKILKIDICAECKHRRFKMFRWVCVITKRKLEHAGWTNIPDWCRLQDAPNTPLHVDSEKQCICHFPGYGYSKHCPIHGYVR